MKERPILFSAPMVRALLSGTKTQTRRALRVQPLDVLPFEGADKERVWVGLKHRGATVAENTGVVFRCKHGEPGDRLWVRETFGCTDLTIDDRHLPGVHYRATDDWPQRGPWPWRPSIFMRRWMSRLTLEVTGVRVERLQDISEADAISEGLESYCDDGVRYWGPLNGGHFDSRQAYFQLWDSINGKGSAAKNPWVWAIDFRKLAP